MHSMCPEIAQYAIQYYKDNEEVSIDEAIDHVLFEKWYLRECESMFKERMMIRSCFKIELEGV